MKRIQRKRTKGWKMPANAVYVGRPSKWGNPFSVKRYGRNSSLIFYEGWVNNMLMFYNPYFLDPLKGKNLVCWCKLNQPCHADILLQKLEAKP